MAKQKESAKEIKPQNARRQNAKRVYEEEMQASSPLVKVIFAIVCFGLALFLLYINLAAPQTGTFMGALRDVMRGIGGSMSILLPMMCIYAGVVIVMALMGRRMKVYRIICHVLLFICAFAMVHLFHAQEIIRLRMHIPGFANFVNVSYQYGSGGGFIGAACAYYLYIFGGTWGGLMILVLFAVILCTVLGYIPRLIRFIRSRAEESEHRADQREKVEKVEQLFDSEGFDEYDAPHVEVRRPRRRTVEQPRNRYTPRPDHMVSMKVDDEPAPAPKPVPRKSGGRKLYQETVEEDLGVQKNLEEELEIPKSLRKIRTERKQRPSDGSSVFGVKYVDEKKETVPEEVPAGDDLFEIREENTEETPAETVVKKPGKAKKVVQEGVRPLGVTDDEDLTIVPEKYEDDDDEPPFDMPEPMPRKGKKAGMDSEKFEVETVEADGDGYNYPPIDLLSHDGGKSSTGAYSDADRARAEKLIETLRSFSIETKLIGIAHGPAVTRFELQPAAGVKVSRITALSDDIALNLAAMSVRIEAPIPGKSAVGVEIPNEKVEMVRLRDVLESGEARRHPSKIAVGLGKDNSGRYIVGDIGKMPHVLIAGQTGSGKSVCINSIITSILYRATPEEVRLILIDPKVVELSIYNDIPHLIAPVVTDPKKAASALDWAVMEMMTRYNRFAEKGVRDIKGYNKAVTGDEKKMPQMVIIIDELADLMMVCPGEVEDSICRLAQLARAAGIHLVIATQRPSVNVITGIIKANIPTRIAFSVSSAIDSRTIIDHGGAEKLLGNGDMLFVPAGMGKQMRVQGSWVSDEEVHAIVSYIKERSDTAYDEDMIEKIENSVRSDAEKEEIAEEYDSRLPEAVEIVVEMGQASVSMLQRRMRVGYARAGRLIDEMERRGIVSEADGAKPRAVLISREQYKQMFEEDFEE